MSDRPNVILIIVDQMRRDALGINGVSHMHTPHLDQLARTGINFTRAYSACPTCVAARATLLTGLSHVRHGFTGYRDGIEWRYPVTLPGTMNAAGYHTQCVGKMHVFPPRNLLGFHNVVLHDGFLHFNRRFVCDGREYDDYLPWLREKLGPDADLCDAGPGCNGYSARVWPWDETFHPSSWVTTQSINFLNRRDPTKPFFLKVSYHRPHPPLNPPRSFMEMFNGVDLPEPPRGDWVDFPLAVGDIENPVPSHPHFRDRARKAYYALITQIDYELNRLFITLNDKQLLEDSLVIFTSDHGDMLYDHNFVRKSMPFEGSAGIPLIVRPPRNSRWNHLRGTTVDTLTELRDIMPTICEACGIDIPSGLDGQSLLKTAAEPACSPREYIHGEHPNGIWSNQWLTDGREKYCWFSQTGRELLFDLQNDPRELHDLSVENGERTAAWRRRLITELAGREEGYVENGQLVIGREAVSAQRWAGTGK